MACVSPGGANVQWSPSSQTTGWVVSNRIKCSPLNAPEGQAAAPTRGPVACYGIFFHPRRVSAPRVERLARESSRKSPSRFACFSPNAPSRAGFVSTSVAIFMFEDQFLRYTLWNSWFSASASKPGPFQFSAWPRRPREGIFTEQHQVSRRHLVSAGSCSAGIVVVVVVVVVTLVSLVTLVTLTLAHPRHDRLHHLLGLVVRDLL